MAGDSSLVWQVFATIIGVSLQAAIAILGWRYTAKNTQDTLDVQHLVSERATASFIAEKRQKWIDELRTDMAFHLALSQEIAWTWEAMKKNAADKVETLVNGDESKRKIIVQNILDDFSKENGQRDREHQERHIRIKLRLNPDEEIHVTLREQLDCIRLLFPKIRSATKGEAMTQLIDEMMGVVDAATETTQEILKKEWQRLKQEVAYPDSLMDTIPRPTPKQSIEKHQ